MTVCTSGKLFILERERRQWFYWTGSREYTLKESGVKQKMSGCHFHGSLDLRSPI